MASFRTRRLNFVDAPRTDLYNLGTDPTESRNRAPTEPVETARFKRVLGAMARAAAAPSVRPGSDPALAEKLMSLGYVGYSPAAAGTAGAGLADPKTKIDVYNLTMTALEQSEGGNLAAALASVA